MGPPAATRLALLPALLLLAACGTSGPAGRPAAADPARRPRPDELLARARALRAGGDVEAARARLEAALEVAPASEEARLELADLLLADGRELGRAAAVLEGVGPTGGVRLHLLRARLAELRGDDAGAEVAYARALGPGGDPDARLRRALALERLGRLAEVTAELEAVRAERPEDPVVRGRLAERYEASGRMADAEAELRALAELRPERAAGWDALARFYERAGRAEEARAADDRARVARGAASGRALRPLPPSRR
jgi:hypothetical protein